MIMYYRKHPLYGAILVAKQLDLPGVVTPTTFVCIGGDDERTPQNE